MGNAARKADVPASVKQEALRKAREALRATVADAKSLHAKSEELVTSATTLATEAVVEDTTAPGQAAIDAYNAMHEDSARLSLEATFSNQPRRRVQIGAGGGTIEVQERPADIVPLPAGGSGHDRLGLAGPLATISEPAKEGWTRPVPQGRPQDQLVLLGPEQEKELISVDHLMAIFRLHKSDPEQWDAKSLAARFGVPVPAVEGALAHTVPPTAIRVGEDVYGVWAVKSMQDLLEEVEADNAAKVAQRGPGESAA
mmetsp:Transcript_101486/g.282763  ORF Transcript_101486/g.282763 Transcript_101486/m.282763 type:complete len:256 (+) Transcript_101486:40-807(+)